VNTQLDDPRVAAYLRHLHSERQLSARTLDAYRRDLDAFSRFIAELHNSEQRYWPAVSPPQVRQFIAREHQRGLSPRSLQRRLSAVRGLFNHLLREGLVEDNPALGIRAPKVARKLPDVLDVDQTGSLLQPPDDDDVLGLRDHAMFELLYGSGLRLSELTGLDLASLDLQGGLVRVLGKGSRERVAPLGRQSRAALRQWLSIRAGLAGIGEHALFVGIRGGRLGPRSVQQRLQNWALQRGLPAVHPHTLRHCFASHLLESSGDLRAVQELLGHANLSTTQVYTHLDFQHLAKVYDRAHPRARRRS
jgi:integrase/recombinase XerC